MRVVWLGLLVLMLVGCASEPATDGAGLQAITAVPTIDRNSTASMCAAVSDYWQDDWPLVIEILEALDGANATCEPGFDASNRLYAAYLGYGDSLRDSGTDAQAIAAYQRALGYNPLGQEAIARLQTLRVETPVPPASCDGLTVDNALTDTATYQPTIGSYVQAEDGALTLFGAVYPVYGINYYPRDYPDGLFLTEMDVDAVLLELDLMNQSGINTLRIHLRHDDLFQCPGDGAIPIPGNVLRLDAFIRAAGERGFKLILVLNTEADLVQFPLYEMPGHIAEQMRFIADRYRAEPAVMAYDLRPRGDADYTTGPFAREQVLLWLAQAATIIRERAPEQLITAGWDDDAAVTAPLVDFVSFQHFGSVDALRQEIALLTDATRKPILLAAFGYNSFDLNELEQRDVMFRALEAVDRNALAGWVIWTAFDYPLALLCPDCEPSPLHRYGVWNTSYFPKRAVDAIELATGVVTLAEINGG